MASIYCLVLFYFAFWCMGYSCLVYLVDLFFNEIWKFNNIVNPLHYSCLENSMDRPWDGKASDTTEELTFSLSFSLDAVEAEVNTYNSFSTYKEYI